MKIRIDIAPTMTTVRDYAQSAIETMQGVYGITLDHSVESLAHVDRVLNEWREGGAPLEAVTKSLYALGAYAGTVLVKQARARWVAPPVTKYGQMDSLFLFVMLPDGRVWRPIFLAVQALMDKPETTLEDSARMLIARPS